MSQNVNTLVQTKIWPGHRKNGITSHIRLASPQQTMRQAHHNHMKRDAWTVGIIVIMIALSFFVAGVATVTAGMAGIFVLAACFVVFGFGGAALDRQFNTITSGNVVRVMTRTPQKPEVVYLINRINDFYLAELLDDDDIHYFNNILWNTYHHGQIVPLTHGVRNKLLQLIEKGESRKPYHDRKTTQRIVSMSTDNNDGPQPDEYDEGSFLPDESSFASTASQTHA